MNYYFNHNRTGVCTRRFAFEPVKEVGCLLAREREEDLIPEAEEEVVVRVEASSVDVPVVQEQQQEEEAVGVRVDDLVVSESRIEDIPPEHIEPVGQVSEADTPTSLVASILRNVLDSFTNTQGEQEDPSAANVPKVVAPGHNEAIQMEDAPIQGEQEILAEDVAPSYNVDVQMENAHGPGEHVVEKDAEFQGEHSASAPEGVVESTSDEGEVHVENVEPVVRASEKGNSVALEIPLLTRKPHRRLRQKKLKVNMKPIIDRLDAQGQILCSVESDIASIFISQSKAATEMGMVRNALRWVRSELGSIKDSVATLSNLIKAQCPAPSAPTPSVQQELGPNVEEVQPSGPSSKEPVGPVDDASGPSGPMESEVVPARADEDQVVAPEPHISSSLSTPAPPSPPSFSTAPPAPTTFKQPLPKHISSPTPFPSQSSSSPASSTSNPPPIVEHWEGREGYPKETQNTKDEMKDN
ncbi:hypothetical protein Taro_018146 [Colocasia esculenta]|uniref:Uncharacterized protein n=1 Tax=Colocasia esculenta TaxID=4460 RepID=A0A843UVE5_COLES|nr:hypothetical protein [Colocasia esculenta]